MTTANERTIETLNKNPEQLIDTLKRHGGLRVSIFLPIAQEPPESEKNVSRLKDLQQAATDKLLENGMTVENVADMMQPVATLLKDPQSLLRPAQALALLIDDESASLVDIPYPVDTKVTVGNRFTVKPLLPLLQHDTMFKLLCLNRGDIKAYQGTRLGIHEVEIPGMPKSLSEVTQYDDPEKSLQHHTAKTGANDGQPGSGPVAQMHGQGMPSDFEEEQIKHLFNEVAKAVKKYFANDSSPMVVIGVDENIGRFGSAIDWGGQEIISIHHDPHDWSKEELLDHALEEMTPHWQKQIEEKVDRLNEAHQKDTGVFDTGKAALASANGRVEMACVASDQTEPGVCQPEEMKVEFVEADDAACAHDLLDTIAYETIQHGGEVFTLPKEKVPGPGNVATTVRF